MPVCPAPAATVHPRPEEWFHLTSSFSFPIQGSWAWLEAGDSLSIFVLRTLYFVLQITGLFYYVKVIILCSCCTPRPTALRSCALGADCLHQSLMPQSVVTHSGKALWRVWVGMATSMYVTFFHACTWLKLQYSQHLSLERIFKKMCLHCCQMQGELEGSARYRELTRSAENFFKQSVASKLR